MLGTAASDVNAHREGMVWIEVTNGCNLSCDHCYSDSHPGSHTRDRLTHNDYLRLLAEAAQAHMSTVQFIGGEPLLYKRLPELLVRAQELPFDNVEVFSNLTTTRPDVLEVIDPKITGFATSVYSCEPSTHDRITRRIGSFRRTIANLRVLVERGVKVRAAFVEMKENASQYERTAAFMREIGVRIVGRDRARPFGRSGEGEAPAMFNLCGSCSGNTMCVTSDGTVLPCIMARAWPLGTVQASSLSTLASSPSTGEIRDRIARATNRLAVTPGQLHISATHACSPDCGPVHCGPQSCGPR